jgi:predicted metal-dependent hydrolase
MIFASFCVQKLGLLQLLACGNDDVIQILDFNVNSSMLWLDWGVMTSTFPHCVMWMQKGFKPKHHESQSKLQAIHL